MLRALWLWRDAEAQVADRPAFHVLHNEQLVEAAARLDVSWLIADARLLVLSWGGGEQRRTHREVTIDRQSAAVRCIRH